MSSHLSEMARSDAAGSLPEDNQTQGFLWFWGFGERSYCRKGRRKERILLVQLFNFAVRFIWGIVAILFAQLWVYFWRSHGRGLSAPLISRQQRCSILPSKKEFFFPSQHRSWREVLKVTSLTSWQSGSHLGAVLAKKPSSHLCTVQGFFCHPLRVYSVLASTGLCLGWQSMKTRVVCHSQYLNRVPPALKVTALPTELRDHPCTVQLCLYNYAYTWSKNSGK